MRCNYGRRGRGKVPQPPPDLGYLGELAARIVLGPGLHMTIRVSVPPTSVFLGRNVELGRAGGC